MLKNIQKLKNKKGFTLVELIIVIAVMAILAAIVVPNIGSITDSFKKRADERSMASLLKEYEIKIQLGDISDAADISATTIAGITPQTDGNFQYAYDASTDTLTISKTGSVSVTAQTVVVNKIE